MQTPIEYYHIPERSIGFSPARISQVGKQFEVSSPRGVKMFSTFKEAMAYAKLIIKFQ